MQHPVSKMIHQLTKGGEVPLSSAAADIARETVDRVDTLAEICERSAIGQNFFVSEEDKVLLDKIEYAGSQAVWGVLSDPGVGKDTVLHVSMSPEGEEISASGIIIHSRMWLLGNHLNILDGGVMALWFNSSRGLDSFLLPAFRSGSFVRERVQILPISRKGESMLSKPGVSELMHAIGGVAQSAIQPVEERPPTGYL